MRGDRILMPERKFICRSFVYICRYKNEIIFYLGQADILTEVMSAQDNGSSHLAVLEQKCSLDKHEGWPVCIGGQAPALQSADMVTRI